MTHKTKIAILEDHPIFRVGIKMSLSSAYRVVLEAGTAGELFSALPTTTVDVVMLDLLLPDLSGVEVARRLRLEYPDVRILVLSVDTREDVFQQLLEIGVDGFLDKSASMDSIHEAIESIIGGGHYYLRNTEAVERDILISASNMATKILTQREYDVMIAFCQGLSCNEIARKLNISPKTVDNHKQHIFNKLGMHNMIQLVMYAIRNKIIQVSQASA